MTNEKIAEIFKEISGQLELEGKNPYRVRAYRRAAEAIISLPEPLKKMALDGRIRSIPGIGKDLEQKILDLLSTGKIRESSEKFAHPDGASSKTAGKKDGYSPDYFSIPGLDPKITRLLHRRFRMETPEDLKNLARSRLLRTVPELGARIERLILKAFKNPSEKSPEKEGSPPESP